MVARAVLPEICTAFLALLVLTVDLAWLTTWSESARKTLLCVVCTLALGIAWILLDRNWEPVAIPTLGWMASPGVTCLKGLIAALTLGSLWLSRESSFTKHVGEYFALTLLAAVGAMILCSTQHLILAFTGLELLSLSLYVLTAFHKDRALSAEAGLKYFLFGGVSAATMLYGFSLLHGATGELLLPKVAMKLAAGPVEPIAVMGVLFASAGFAFKISAAPFHLWTPDAYQGATPGSAAFIASVSKLASFALLAQVTWVGWNPAGVAGNASLGSAKPGWIAFFAFAATASIVIGNLAALAQSGFRRFIAYSGVAHAGYMLVGLIANTQDAAYSVLYYAVTYAIGSLGLIAMSAILENRRGSDAISGFAGWMRESRFLAVCLMVFLLSQAGIPPLAGFFAKFYVFSAALKSHGAPHGVFWLVAASLVASCVALYYYLRIVRAAFEARDLAEAGQAPGMPALWITRAWIGACALLLVWWGCFPDKLLSLLRGS